MNIEQLVRAYHGPSIPIDMSMRFLAFPFAWSLLPMNKLMMGVW
ncbi:hypothetical protein [Burkholderia sp. Bp8986]|nr:hypothetical protein [Burkholderia sp. Bp8986]